MIFTCISASNVEKARTNSASTRVCEMIRDMLSERSQADVRIVPLLDYEMKPCRMCGSCFELGRCARDDAFNAIYAQLGASDGIFIVCPHYASIPSKVMMILEKLQQMLFLKSCAEQGYRSPLYKKPVGIIAHGGQTEQARPYYKTALLDPIAAALASVQMEVIGAGEEWPNGATFGIKSLTKPADSIFVTIEHDWEAVRQHILPLVENVAAAVARAAAN